MLFGVASLTLLALPLLLTAGVAEAQVHWDASAEAGLMKRFATGGDARAPEPGFGPSLELQGHVALVPMIRIGAYLASDLSPAGAEGPRFFWAGGLHVRVSPPLLAWPWRTWVFAGFGHAYTRDLSAGLPGGLFDVPVGLGLGRKLTRRWMVFTELGARLGFAFDGPMYDPAAATILGLGGPPGSRPFVGRDVFALSLSMGLSLDE
jgi:hypothetical protein